MLRVRAQLQFVASKTMLSVAVLLVVVVFSYVTNCAVIATDTFAALNIDYTNLYSLLSKN